MVNAGAGLDCWSSPRMDAEQRRQWGFRERRREAEERRGWRGSARIHGIEARANSSPRSPSSRACRGTWQAGRSDPKRRRRWQGTWGGRRRWLKAPATGTTGGVRSGVGESIPGDKMTWRSAGLEILAATMRSKAAGASCWSSEGACLPAPTKRMGRLQKTKDDGARWCGSEADPARIRRVATRTIGSHGRRVPCEEEESKGRAA